MATEKELRQQAANWLAQYVGIKKNSTQHKAILDVFNNSKLCTRYKMTTGDAWCATGASAAFIASGLAGKGKLFNCVECSCGNMIKLAQAEKIWVEADDYVPSVGDLVLYDWQDTGSGNNQGWPDHVGIVSSISGDTFKVIEANMNNTVGYRSMVVNGRYIRGFITPNYAKFATAAPAAKPAATPSTQEVKFKGKVTASWLNVRSSAGTAGSKVLRSIKKDTVVEVYDIVKDKDGDDWYYIKESGSFGYVSPNYIQRIATTASTTTSKPAATTKPTTTTTTSKPAATTTTTTSKSLNKTCKYKGKTTTSLNVRSWAGAENQKLRVLAKGKIVEICDERKASNGQVWYYIKESGKYGFVCGAYIARI